MPELSVVLPCYNESGNLKNILDRYRPLASKVPLDLILVDNGSTDNTKAILQEALGRPENAFALRVTVEKNIGYGYGIQAGLKECRTNVVAFSHADLQCPPEDLLTAYGIYKKESAAGPCLVKGRRKGRRPTADRIVTWFYNHLTRILLRMNVTLDVNAEPKLFPISLVKRLLEGPLDFTFDLFVLHAAQAAGYRLLEFEVSYEPRAWGRSKLAANPWMRLLTSLKAFRRLIQLSLH